MSITYDEVLKLKIDEDISLLLMKKDLKLLRKNLN